MTPETIAKIAAARAKGLFLHQSDERAARMLGATAAFHAKASAAFRRFGDTRNAEVAAKAAKALR